MALGTPSTRPGPSRTLIRSCVLNPVVPAFLNFPCYGDKGRHKAHRSPGSLHSTSFSHYCRHRNSLSSSPPVDPSLSLQMNGIFDSLPVMAVIGVCVQQVFVIFTRAASPFFWLVWPLVCAVSKSCDECGCFTYWVDQRFQPWSTGNIFFPSFYRKCTYVIVMSNMSQSEYLQERKMTLHMSL